jgi:hypothetical protein
MDLAELSGDQVATAPDQITGQNQPPGGETLATAETGQSAGAFTVQTVLLVLLVLLALLAIGAGLGAFFLRRSAHR